MFLMATIFKIIDLQFAASHKDYAVKYLFWKFPINSDTSCKLWIFRLYTDCFSIGLHATFSPKYRNYEKDSMGSMWSMWSVGSLRLCQPERRRFRRYSILLCLNFFFLNHIIGFCKSLPLYRSRHIKLTCNVLSIYKLEIKIHLLKGTNISHLLSCIEKASILYIIYIYIYIHINIYI